MRHTRLAAGRRLCYLGPLAIVPRSQPTIRKALEVLRRYAHLLAEAVPQLFEEPEGVLLIRAEPVPDRLEPVRQATELSPGNPVGTCCSATSGDPGPYVLVIAPRAI